MRTMSLRLVKVQTKKTPNGEVSFVHLPKEWVRKAQVTKGDYLVWEIDGRGRLILKKLR